jgi:hypothetical protein
MMGGRAEVGAADPPGGDRRIVRWLVLVGVVLLLVIWFVLSFLVLDVVVADAVIVAAAVAWLAAAAWWARKRRKGDVFMWFAAFLSITTLIQLFHDLASEHRWPAGQMHELLIAGRIGQVPALACLAMFLIVLIRKLRRTTTGRESSDPTAT